jgi:hypothetical protein
VLSESHEKSFGSWICLTLEQQKADLDLYLSGLSRNRRTILDTWIRLQPYRNLVPRRGKSSGNSIWLIRIRFLACSTNEYGLASPDPDA